MSDEDRTTLAQMKASHNSMDVFERISSWIGLAPRSASPQVLALREALDSGRRAKRAERYEQALADFSRASQLAVELNDNLATAIIELHRADVYVHQGDFDTAETVLADLRRDAESRHENTQLAYAICSQGTLAQARGDLAAARRCFEQALEAARRETASGAEGRAMGHLADTYMQDGNASYAAHLLREALPKLNTSGDIEMSSYFVGLLGQALIESGQAAEGQQLVNRALRLAEHMQYRVYERQWRLVLGRFAQEQGAFHDANAHFRRALQLFEGAPPSAEYVQALIQASKSYLNIHQNPEALDNAHQAVAAAEALGNTTLILTAKGSLGVVLRTLGRHAEAIPFLEAAAAVESANPAQLDILRNLAASQSESADVEVAVATYRRACELAEKSGNRLELAHSRRDLGLLYARNTRMQAAIPEWTAALGIYEAEKQHPQVALLYCDIGNARRYLGQGQRAIKDFEKGLMALNSVDDLATRGIVLSNAANAYVDQGDLDSVDAFYAESIKIAQQIGDRLAETTRRGNYGWFLLATNRAQRAEVALEQALQMSKTLGMDLQIAVQTDNLGLVYDELGKLDKALAYHQQALQFIRNQNVPHWEAVVKANLANTHLALSEIGQAETFFDEVLETGRAAEDVELVVHGLTGKARAALKQKRPEAAGEMLAEAVSLARKGDLRRLLALALTVYSQQQAALGQAMRAADLWKEAKKLFTLLHASQAAQEPDWLQAMIDT